MLRLFKTHNIRKEEELTGKLWNFTPLDQDQRDTILVSVPSCWETYPGFENYRGEACYETTFEAEGNIRLEFKGVSHMGKVYVDNIEITSHYNSYTIFDAIVKGLKAGTHTLKVVVDNSFKEEYALDFPNDYMSYGGISRGVSLQTLSEAYISIMHVTPINENGMWKAKVELYINNISEDEQTAVVHFQLHNTKVTSKELSLPKGESKVMDEILLIEDVEAWSPENPKLYDMTARLYMNEKLCDDRIDRTGFRTIEVSGNRILLNGEPLYIKGFCRHEDHPQYGCSLPFQAMAYDLSLLKDLGANAVRTSHYPNDEIFLDLCDEMGILVWEENHWRGGDESHMRNPYFETQCEQVIREMIRDHYNHPSIYIWGILNECASESEYGRGCYQAQIALIHELDSVRPASFASCRFLEDICMDLPDVVSWNIYPYWYQKKTASQMIDELYQYSQETGGKGKPFLITEIGAGGIYGFRSHDRDPWSEEYQADTLRKQISEVMAYENCMGIYIWQFCDIRVHREWLEKRPRTRNNKGVVDEFRRRKLAYDVVKELFHENTHSKIKKY